MSHGVGGHTGREGPGRSGVRGREGTYGRGPSLGFPWEGQRKQDKQAWNRPLLGRHVTGDRRTA